MANKAFLSANEKRDLMEYVAGKGENYDRYIEWCEANGIGLPRRYTPDYFHRWVTRRREYINVLKEQHRAEVRKSSMLDKQSRVELLEASVERISAVLSCADNEMSVADAMKLEEQLGKQLERIAKERGEFAKAAPDTDPMKDLNKAIAQEALAQLRQVRALTAPTGVVVEGEVRVVNP